MRILNGLCLWIQNTCSIVRFLAGYWNGNTLDTLSDVLNSVRFKGAMYGLFEFSAPWGLRFPEASGHIRIFMVVRGGCLIQLAGDRQPTSLAAGEILLARKDTIVELKDASASPVIPIEEACTAIPTRGHTLKLGGGGAASTLMVGCFTLDAQHQNPVLSSLPDIIHLRSQDVQAAPGLETTIRLLISEVAGNGPGGDILVSRLSDAIFIQIVRTYIAQIKHCNETPGWLKAVADHQIGPALSLIHEKPEAPWTVASLANAVNMSRTSFATKFAALVQSTPIDYLTSWRMQKAVVLMREGCENVEEISTAVGYTSRASFAKAFKKEFGRSPGEFRKELLQN